MSTWYTLLDGEKLVKIELSGFDWEKIADSLYVKYETYRDMYLNTDNEEDREFCRVEMKEVERIVKQLQLEVGHQWTYNWFEFN